MNMQAMMKQAQKLQKDMLNIKNEIDNTIFEGESNLVHVKVNGKKEVLEVNIDMNELEKDDKDILQDMIVVALNDAFKKVDKTTEDKMSKFENIPGLF